jgi:hypothetical protein
VLIVRAGSFGVKGSVDEHLAVEWKSVLPIGHDYCPVNGAIPLARTKERIGADKTMRA